MGILSHRRHQEPRGLRIRDISFIINTPGSVPVDIVGLALSFFTKRVFVAISPLLEISCFDLCFFEPRLTLCLSRALSIFKNLYI